jgi:hypothetical protein
MLRPYTMLRPEGGDASAWPPFCWIVAYKDREEKRNTETMGRLGTQRLRPTRPPGRSGPLDRTAGGIGGAAPASLDLYGQSRTSSEEVIIRSGFKFVSVSASITKFARLKDIFHSGFSL